MNIIKIMGGLGNQLFQYAFGKAQQENGISVAYDYSFYDKHSVRLRKWRRFYRLDKFHTSVPLILKNSNLPTLKENNRALDLTLLKTQPYYFDGYWQFPAYTQDILPLLREEFRLKPEFITKACKEVIGQMLDSNSVSLHVRRGDYVFQKGFYNLPFRYYLEAIAACPGDHLFIFSDNIEWCKSLFLPECFKRKITFVEGFEDYQDFEMMKYCKHHIIANSTMSYWVAYLEDREDSVIVCPSGWTSGSRELGDTERMKAVDKLYYNESWIKL